MDLTSAGINILFLARASSSFDNIYIGSRVTPKAIQDKPMAISPAMGSRPLSPTNADVQIN